MSRPRAQGSGTAGAGLPRHRITRVRFTTLDPPFGASCMQRKDVDTGRFQRARRYRRGSVALRLSASVLRYEVLSASYQYKLAASLGRSASLVPVLPSRLLALMRSSIAAALLSLSPLSISLTTARSLSPLSIYLSLIFSSSFSLLLSAHLHLNMPRFIASASSGMGSIEDTHFLPSFFIMAAEQDDAAPRPCPLGPLLAHDRSRQLLCQAMGAQPAPGQELDLRVGMVAACS